MQSCALLPARLLEFEDLVLFKHGTGQLTWSQLCHGCSLQLHWLEWLSAAANAGYQHQSQFRQLVVGWAYPTLSSGGLVIKLKLQCVAQYTDLQRSRWLCEFCCA